MIKKYLFPLLFLCLVTMATPARAVLPDEILPDAALEARARDISATLRCLVCQSESIDDSNADLAKDLRRIVRERLTAGDSDKQVLDFLQSRYGDYILLNPPLEEKTALLWFAPALIFMGGLSAVLFFIRKQKRL
jgi:cytochrome c-type biogenesis protein CcmH